MEIYTTLTGALVARFLNGNYSGDFYDRVRENALRALQTIEKYPTDCSTFNRLHNTYSAVLRLALITNNLELFVLDQTMMEAFTDIHVGSSHEHEDDCLTLLFS
ncbi:hypothetical protein A2963_00310 [Candidatus Roizmanbacteria bacterium RIFCSPLOWO2_01_FULL_40_13]|nr:MAG: hypothetical protein A2963_00310 [Candidatus Roizmanbacteria bacterium RIFCSPLOWO2_01_FULL_40_13]